LDYLSVDNPSQDDENIRITTKKGLPCGNEKFVYKLGVLVKRDLRLKGLGRPKSKNKG
jgi:hypothetical protein